MPCMWTVRLQEILKLLGDVMFVEQPSRWRRLCEFMKTPPSTMFKSPFPAAALLLERSGKTFSYALMV